MSKKFNSIEQALLKPENEVKDISTIHIRRKGNSIGICIRVFYLHGSYDILLEIICYAYLSILTKSLTDLFFIVIPTMTWQHNFFTSIFFTSTIFTHSDESNSISTNVLDIFKSCCKILLIFSFYMAIKWPRELLQMKSFRKLRIFLEA
ncbi:hypothetical protein ENBRE01_3530, partial [Enteropsectra breve]